MRKRPVKGEKPKPGRPFKEINLELLKRMAARHSTMEEMADCLGCSTMTLRTNYLQVIQEEKARGKLSLRDHQWKILEKGSADMAKWLGRCVLGQNEGVSGVTEVQLDNLTKLTDTIAQARAEDSPSPPESNSTESI